MESPPRLRSTTVVTSPCAGKTACSSLATTCAQASTASAADSKIATADGAWSASVAKAILPSGKVTREPGNPDTPEEGRAEVQKRCFLNCVNGALMLVSVVLEPKTLRKSTGVPVTSSFANKSNKDSDGSTLRLSEISS